MNIPGLAGAIGYLEGSGSAPGHSVPAFRLSVDGLDIAAKISPRLISLELTDNRGMEADQLSLQLSDHDGLLALPRHGAVIRLWLGWSDSGLVDKGSYTVDEVEHSGAPNVLSIRARSADLRQGLKTKRERTWTATTLGAVMNDIALGNDLKPTVDKAMQALDIAQLEQANESDANLITRLAEEFDAVKAGSLVCLPIGGGKTASGVALPHVTLTRAEGDQHRYLQADRGSYDGVRAYYYDLNKAERKEAVAGGGDNLKDLRHTYSDRSSALRAARSEWARVQRGRATLSYTLAKGRAELMPEMTYSLQGVKAEIADAHWRGVSIRHSMNADSGYSASIDLESRCQDTILTKNSTFRPHLV